MEYRTTRGGYETPWEDQDGRKIGHYQADDPEPPEGDGWTLVGAAAADGLLFWFWQRPAVSGKDG